jgi:hypothetical protein
LSIVNLNFPNHCYASPGFQLSFFFENSLV